MVHQGWDSDSGLLRFLCYFERTRSPIRPGRPSPPRYTTFLPPGPQGNEWAMGDTLCAAVGWGPVAGLEWVAEDVLLLDCRQGEKERRLLAISDFNQEMGKVKVVSLQGLFPSIDPDAACVPMLLASLPSWHLCVVAAPASVDDHINLVGWDGYPHPLTISNDRWLPRIAVGEDGADSLVRGMGVDFTQTERRLKDPRDDTQQRQLAPSPTLLCLTNHGHLAAFSMGR